MAKAANKSSGKSVKKPRKPLPNWVKLSLVAAGMTLVVIVASVALQIIAWERNTLDDELTSTTSYNYGGTVEQRAPSINAISSKSSVYLEMEDITSAKAAEYAENTNLVSTDGDVVINLDLKKRGLRYEPTYTTEFRAVYILENTSDEEVAVEFEFPFPENMRDKEINNAKLLVDGEEQEKSVRRSDDENSDDYYNYYYYEDTSDYKSGLYWEGKIAAGGQREVEVRYNTVGLGQLSYVGIENPEGSQDFQFIVTILGSRKYDNLGSLTIDDKEYINEDGQNGVILTWNKPDLFSSPNVEVAVGTRVNPSRHLSEIYKIMVPLYIAFAVGLIIMTTVLKKDFGGVDMLIVSVLFIVFFPFLHYLVSFNIDPSADVLANYAGVVDFSMPLYGAFAIALGLVGGLIVYLLARVSGGSFAAKVGIPLVVVFMAFFPLAMTLPEYKYLLALIGVVAILAVVVQLRVSKKLTRNGKK